MSAVVIFAEEPSARVVFEVLATKLDIAHQVIVLEHQGKADLERSFPVKIAKWRAAAPPRFVVSRDKDISDCRTLKSRLAAGIPKYARQRVKIRIIVHELESWFLGDLRALVESGFVSPQKFAAIQNKALYRNPDAISNAKQQLRKLIGEPGTMFLARSVAPHLNLTRNRSASFRHFVAAMRWATGAGE